jgi:hypothetical protein
MTTFPHLRISRCCNPLTSQDASDLGATFPCWPTLPLSDPLDLSGCDGFRGDLSPLAKLTSLQSLNLSSCRHLDGDLSPLAKLISLQSLNLSECEQLRELTWELTLPAGLTSLQTLNLSGCSALRQFDPVKDAYIEIARSLSERVRYCQMLCIGERRIPPVK